jgi:hypothetical protein
VLLQFALGPLHIHILKGRKLSAEPITHGGASLVILAVPSVESSFQILAD